MPFTYSRSETKVVRYLSEKLFVNYRFDIADITPQVIWSSIMTDLPGVSLVNGIPQFAAPVVPVNVTVPYQLSWLPAVHPAAFLPVQFSRPPSYNWSGNEVVVEPTGEEYLSESHVT